VRFYLLAVVGFSLITSLARTAERSSPEGALQSLKQALERGPTSLAELAELDFAKISLDAKSAAEARTLLWKAHTEIIKKNRTDEIKNRVLKEKELEMPIYFDTFGKKPDGGRSLWISLHGGGGTTAKTNDGQWNNQKKLYQIDEGIYLAPRAPTNTWNLWHQDHIDRLFTRLIEDLIVLEEVNPDRVYVLGYSAGGDGVYQIAPRMADQWAAAAMMAGHPNGVSLLSLRNLPFALQVGANDSAYDRNKVGKQYGEQLEQLRKDDPKGYEHFVKIREGMGHWMNREDKEALPWMAKFSRNPIPEKIVWKQTGAPHERFYWLAVPKVEMGSLVVVERGVQEIEILKSEKVKQLTIRLDDRMLNLNRPIKIHSKGKELFAGEAKRTIATMIRTLVGRGDPKLIFDAEVTVELGE
jgi:hypothetical protein